MKRTCNHCSREYDPSYDFIEDYETIEALSFFINSDNYCSTCLYSLHEQLKDTVYNFLNMENQK